MSLIIRRDGISINSFPSFDFYLIFGRKDQSSSLRELFYYIFWDFNEGNIEKRKIQYFSKMGFTLYDSLSSVNLEATHVAVFVKLNLWLLEHFEIAMSFLIA